MPVAMLKVSTPILAIAASVLFISPTYAQQGKTIQLNGQPIAGQWLLRDGRIFIQDHWLRQNLGVEFMDSDRPEAQKLRWFSAPLSLSVAYDQPVQHRFLNIQALTPDWQTEVVGEILRISSPNTTITNLRRSRQQLGDRLVIELDRAAPWQLERGRNSLTLAIAANLATNVTSNLSNSLGNLIKNVAIAASGKQTILKIDTTRSINPNIQTLNNPNRLVIDLQPTYTPPDLAIAWARGLTYRQQTVLLPAVPKSLGFIVHSLIIDLKEPSISLKPIWANPDRMTGTAPLGAIANTWQAAAAINGGFFNRERQMPVGAVRSEQRWLAGGVLNRGAVAWDNKGNVLLDRLQFSEEIITSQGNLALTHLNSGFVQTGLARYTPNWGSTYVPLTSGEIIFVVNGDRLTNKITARNNEPIKIPENGYILVARKAPDLKLNIGQQIKGITTVTPEKFKEFPHLLGAGPLLLKNGTRVLDAARERFLPPFDTRGATRSAIATTNIAGQIILATIQATPEGTLPSLSQTADILQKMGAVNALNLDGGSSTTLYLGGRVVNRQTTAPVHNGIGVFINSQQ